MEYLHDKRELLFTSCVVLFSSLFSMVVPLLVSGGFAISILDLENSDRAGAVLLGGMGVGLFVLWVLCTGFLIFLSTKKPTTMAQSILYLKKVCGILSLIFAGFIFITALAGGPLVAPVFAVVFGCFAYLTLCSSFYVGSVLITLYFKYANS